MPISPTREGYEFAVEKGRHQVRPLPPPAGLRDLAPLVRKTAWPTTPMHSSFPHEVELFTDLAFCHVVRGVALLTLMAKGVEAEGDVLKALQHTPYINGERVVSSSNVWCEPAILLRDAVTGACPEAVKELLRGRVQHALEDHQGNQADVFAELATDSVSAFTEDVADQAYGAQVATALYGTFLGVESLRWPLAAVWAVNKLVGEWVDWADNTAPHARATTLGLAPWGSSGPFVSGRPPQNWSDLVELDPFG